MAVTTTRFGFASAARNAPLALAVFTNTTCCSENGSEERVEVSGAQVTSREVEARFLVVEAPVADEQEVNLISGGDRRS